MELGSESAPCLTSTEDHHVIPSSNAGHSDGSFVNKNSSPRNGILSVGVSEESDEMISKVKLFVVAEGPSNGEIATRLDNVTEMPLENGDVEVTRTSEVQQRCDSALDTDLCTINTRESMEQWKNEMEEGEHVRKWNTVEELPSAVQESTGDVENLAANHNLPERTMPASRRRMFFLVKMPRVADSELRSKIKLAELQLEEASKTRDVIRAALQLRRASKIGLLDKLKVVRERERACKDAFQKKRLEIEPFQIALNRLKFADTKFKEEEIFSEEDLDNKIAYLQHRIQHESIPLKEEKQLIREIKQLESRRSQVCANDAEHAHLLENYGPKEDIQDQLDILYTDLDVLRENQNQARLECKPIEKDLEDLNVKIDELVGQLEAAKHSQAAALAACKELKKSLNGQNAEFYKYKDSLRKAKELASSKNVEDVAVFCNEQVENFLQYWNNNPSFREDYIKNNVHSTLRRLETLDGRSLGLDEEPLLLLGDSELATETQPKDMDASFKRVGLQKEAIVKSPVSSVQGNHIKEPQTEKLQQPQEKIMKGTSGNVTQKKEVKEVKKSGGKLIQSVIDISPALSLATTPPSLSTAPAPVEDAAAKEAKAAELKEKRRQEEMAKAREAAERKRRQAERAQAKAQHRAQKEAERREKERAKKARKRVADGVEGEKIPETQAVEEKENELGTQNLPKTSERGSSSLEGKLFSGKRFRSQKPPVLNPHPTKKTWQLSFVWLWVSLVVVVIGLVLTFVAKF